MKVDRKLLQIGWRVAGVVATIYVVVLVFAWSYQRNLLYLPPATYKSPEEAGHKNVTEIPLVTEDGVRIVALHSQAPHGAPTVVYFHGNGGAAWMFVGLMQDIQKAGFGGLLVSYRGYPGSEGSPSEEGTYADGRAALNWLAGQGVTSEQIFLFGHSLGTGVVVKLASERKVGGIILESPYTSTVDVAALTFPLFPVAWLMSDRYDSFSRIKDVHVPLLLMHGVNDESIPLRLGRQLFEAANQPKVAYFPKTGRHNDLYRHGSIEHMIAFVEANRSKATLATAQ